VYWSLSGAFAMGILRPVDIRAAEQGRAAVAATQAHGTLLEQGEIINRRTRTCQNPSARFERGLSAYGLRQLPGPRAANAASRQEPNPEPGTSQGLALDIPLFVGTSPWLVASICLARSARLEDRYTALYNEYEILVWSRIAVQEPRTELEHEPSTENREV
jgi:hypothetical protein